MLTRSHYAQRLTQPFYLVRHGRTQPNAQGSACGIVDWPLTSDGEEQVRHAAHLLKPCIVDSPSTILHSTMRRAMQTARIMGDILAVPTRPLAHLHEQHLGSWEGKPWPYVLKRLESNAAPPGGESRDVYAARVWDALDGLDATTAQARQTIVVAHGGTFFALGWPWRRVSMDIPNAVPFKMTPTPHASEPWLCERVGDRGERTEVKLYRQYKGE